MYSSISCVATVLAILVLVVFGEVELRALQRKHLVPFIWVASLTAVDMGSTNIAVETISVALQQTIKAALPAVVVILELVLQVTARIARSTVRSIGTHDLVILCRAKTTAVSCTSRSSR